MLTFLAFLFFGSIISFIYWSIWHRQRQNLTDENKKIDFLTNRFLYLKGQKYDKETISNTELEFLEVWLKRKGRKKGEIIDVFTSLPFNEKKPWKVFVTIKSKEFVFSVIHDKDDLEIFSILDKDLENLDDYKSYQYSGLSKEME